MAETTGAIAALLITRRWGAGPLSELAGERLRRLLAMVERRGFVAVLYARVVPGVPRGIANYAFGLTRVALRPFTAATALGTAPRAFAYAALGSAASLGRLESPEAIAAPARSPGWRCSAPRFSSASEPGAPESSAARASSKWQTQQGGHSQ